MIVERAFSKKSNGHSGNGCKTENPYHLPKENYRDNKRRMPKYPSQKEKKKQSNP
jgi:hypothetical protein